MNYTTVFEINTPISLQRDPETATLVCKTSEQGEHSGPEWDSDALCAGVERTEHMPVSYHTAFDFAFIKTLIVRCRIEGHKTVKFIEARWR